MIEIEQKPGYLYLLRNTLLGGYKIGITTAPQQRFKALSVGDKSELLGYWQHDGYRELEKHYHKLYKDQRCPQSEWFALEPEMITEIVDQMHSSAVTEYLSPELQPQFIGSQFLFKDVPPYQDKGMADHHYFGLLIIAMSLAYFIGALIS